MDAAAVARAMQEAMAQVTYVLQIDSVTAASCLAKHNYDADAAIQEGMQQQLGAATTAQPYASSSEASPAAAAGEGGLVDEAAALAPRRCLVCFDDVPAQDVTVTMPCGHCTCDAW